MKRKRILILLLAAALVTLPLGVLAAGSLLTPKKTAGGYRREIVDRIEATADATEFTFKAEEEGGQAFQAALTLTLKKTEADFYVLLDDLYLEGFDADSVEFLCETPGFADAAPGGLALPVQNNAPAELRYRVLITFRAEPPAEYAPALCVEFTSGMSEQTADAHLLRIPLKIEVTG